VRAQEPSRPRLHPALGVDRLVWFEAHEAESVALLREKQLKEWGRDWKIDLIEHDNPHWSDHYTTLTQ
jgi:putative endonuclease